MPRLNCKCTYPLAFLLLCTMNMSEMKLIKTERLQRIIDRVLVSDDYAMEVVQFIGPTILQPDSERESSTIDQTWEQTNPLQKYGSQRGFANNKGTDQPAYPRSLISVFIIRLLNISYLDLLRAKFQMF